VIGTGPSFLTKTVYVKVVPSSTFTVFTTPRGRTRQSIVSTAERYPKDVHPFQR